MSQSYDIINDIHSTIRLLNSNLLIGVLLSNTGSLSDVNQSPYHTAGNGAQPPNYQDTINNLYHRQQNDGNSKYANPAKLQQEYASRNGSYGGYSNDNSPVHQYAKPGYDGYVIIVSILSRCSLMVISPPI